MPNGIKMRSANPALRQLRQASSLLLSAESTLSRTSQPASILSSPASQCATVSTTASRRASSSSSSTTTTRKFVPRSSSKPFTPTGSNAAPAPAARQQASSRESPSVMTVDDVDPTLSPLPSAPSSKPTNSSSSSSASKGNFAESLQTPGYAPDGTDPSIDWSSSFHGLSTTAFEPHVASILMAPLDPDDIEIKPDGIAYLPEIKYRRILNQAFGPGGWGLAPRGELSVGDKVVTREYALVVGGRFVAQARGECGYFSDDTIPTAAEGCKSNALSRCCKDLGIASELWDPRFLRTFKKKHCHEIWVEHVVNKKKRQIWTRKDQEPGYPYVTVKSTGGGGVKKTVRDADGFVRGV